MMASKATFSWKKRSDSVTGVKAGMQALVIAVAAVVFCSVAIYASIPLYARTMVRSRESADPFDISIQRVLRGNSSDTEDHAQLEHPKVSRAQHGIKASVEDHSEPTGSELSRSHHEEELRLPLPDGPGLNAVAASLASDAWTVRIIRSAI